MIKDKGIFTFKIVGEIMEISLIGANIVVLAENHNPSIISKDWLSQKGIIKDNVISFTHTPAFSVVETENFSFFVDPDRLQLTLKNDFINKVDFLPEMILSYTSALPETPYIAVGFNFSYNLNKEDNTLQEIYCYDNKKFKSLFTEDYQLGSIIKYKFSNFAVSFTIQPDSDNNIKADFNFHCQLTDSININECIRKYKIAKEYSKTTLERVFQ